MDAQCCTCPYKKEIWKDTKMPNGEDYISHKIYCPLSECILVEHNHNLIMATKNTK